MTDLPPDTPESETPDSASDAATPSPREKAKRKRSLIRTVAVFTGIGVGALVGIGVIALVGGRYYLVSDAGRELITSFVAGKKIGRYGAINVEGVRGDIFDDFTIQRVTVTDKDGVWLEARDVHVDWNYWSLLVKRFHADEITAKSIHLIRRPELEPSLEPSGPQALSIDIDKFAADVELMEDFSKEYGKWRLSGSAGLPRTGNKDIKVDALSLSRPGDFLKVQAVLSDKPEDIRLSLQAQEAKGGPLAGSLGYSPDQPFSATGLMDGRNVRMVMTTGEFTPLRINGHFSEANSYMSGYVNFSGSDLMEPFIQRFGRTASIGLAAAPDSKREGYQGMAWKLVAENITSTASGYVRTTGGSYAENIKLTVRTPSLTRLAGTKIGDAAAYEGVFSGDAKKFSLNGSVDVRNAELAGYGLSRLSGPLGLEAKDQTYTVKGQLAGAGGTTKGVIGGLLGSSPRLNLTASRLNDGNILLQDVDLKGSALNLTGSGRRNLMGGLSFNADFDVNNIGVIKPGARGRFGGKLRGSMPRSGGAWGLNFDGGGRDFFFGIEEVDRLLGRSPKLKLNGSLANGTIHLTEGSRLIGEKADVAAKGTLKGDQLNLALDWKARGPFGVGPVAIDGNMAGDGFIVGKLNTPRTRFNADFEKVAIGQLILNAAKMGLEFNVGDGSSDGFVTLTGMNRGQAARGQARFRLGKDTIALSDVDVNAGGITAKGFITLSDLIPSTADLEVTGRPGAFIQRGEVRGYIKLPANAGPESVDVSLRARDLILRGSNMHFSRIEVVGQGNLSALTLNTNLVMTGENPISFQGPLVYRRLSDGHRLEGSGNAVIRGIRAQLLPSTFVERRGDTNRALVAAQLGDGTATLALDPRPLGRGRTGWDAKLNLQNVPLKSLNSDLQGLITGTANLSNTGAPSLDGGADVVFSNAGSASVRADQNNVLVDGRLIADLQAREMNIRACAAYGNRGGICDPRNQATQGALALLDLTLPMINQANPAKLVTDETRNLSGDLKINGEIKPLWDLVDGIDRKLEGNLRANVTLSGRVRSPTIVGNVALTDGKFNEGSTGLRLKDVFLNADFNQEGVRLSRLSAKDYGNGQLCGFGTLWFERRGSALPNTFNETFTCDLVTDNRLGGNRNADASLGNLTLGLKNFRLVENDVATVNTSGTVQVERYARAITLRGTLNVDKAEITPNLPGSNGIIRAPVTDRNAVRRPVATRSRSEATPLLSTPIALNVNLTADEIEVRGRGLDLLLRTDARIRGTLASPELSGTANVVRGDYDFAGKRFTFDDDGSITLSTDPAKILLNLTATREDPSITAIIKVTGTAASPKIALTSEPELPQDEILARVLFGRSVSQLSALEAAQLASGVASLAGGGGLDIIGNLRELAGLDRLSFGGEASNMTIAGGRRLGKNLYLEIIGGGEAGATVRVEWQVRRNIAVTSAFSGDNTSNISIRWRRERD